MPALLGGQPETGSQPLVFHAQAVIERNFRSQRPVILRVCGKFQIGPFVCSLIRKVDALQSFSRAVKDIYGTKSEYPAVIHHCQ